MSSQGKRLFETYLGDGAYAYLSLSRDIVLYTSNGIEETNTVVLEPSVLRSFERWLKAAKAADLSSEAIRAQLGNEKP